MHLSYISVCGLCLLLNLQLFSTYPISTSLTSDDVDILKALLHKLEESVSEQTEEDQSVPVERGSLENTSMDGDEERQQQTGLDEAAIREFLSAKNLKSVRNNDAPRRSSGCFGQRMDRISSRTSLGCNTVGKFTSRQK